jgi:hypothetical protein
MTDEATNGTTDTTTNDGTNYATAVPDGGYRVVRDIPFPLADEQKARIGEHLAGKLSEKAIIEAGKRSAIAAANEQLKEINADITRLSDSIRTSTELREVECIERPGLVNGAIEVVRCDTGEIVETITADEAEHDHAQPGLPFPLERPGKACSVCSMADGSHHPDCAELKADAAEDDFDANDFADDGEEILSRIEAVQPPSDTPLPLVDGMQPLVPVKPRRSRKASSVEVER